MKIFLVQFIAFIFCANNSFSLDNPIITKEYIYHYENILGTSLQLKVIAPDESIADKAEQMALKEIDRLTSILSTYNPDSEISLWQKTFHHEVSVSRELFEVLQLFDYWQTKTNGALNASIGTAIHIWKKADQNNQIPDNQELAAAVEAMKKPQWMLNFKNGSATRLGSSSLMFNTFVKGYIINKVYEKLTTLKDISDVVINIGGDILVTGQTNQFVLITDPLKNAENDRPLSTINLRNRAVATSGNYRRGFILNGQSFSHIIDPRTARPVSNIISATVIAPKMVDACALATAFNVLAVEESILLAASIDSVEYKIITSNGEAIESKGWKELELKGPMDDEINPLQNKLSVEFQLAGYEGRYRRPFVAVWIENKKKEPVRTLALWYNKRRWLPDLKRWYSKNQSILQDSVSSSLISSATRTAGKYALSWDGISQNGKAAPSGTYTLFIEVAREHGTYQLIKQEFQLNGKPKHFEMEGGTEVTSATLDIFN
jgi:thiamine biosynthesis lipoprotein ApbE